MDWGLHNGEHPLAPEGCTDANYITDNDEINLTSGYVFILAEGAISRKSAK